MHLDLRVAAAKGSIDMPLTRQRILGISAISAYLLYLAIFAVLHFFFGVSTGTSIALTLAIPIAFVGFIYTIASGGFRGKDGAVMALRASHTMVSLHHLVLSRTRSSLVCKGLDFALVQLVLGLFAPSNWQDLRVVSADD